MTGLEQIGIAIFGVAAIRLSQDERESVRRWACLFGMLAQPFWFYTTAVNGQWGIFALSFFYTWAWWKGVRMYWLRKDAGQPLARVSDEMVVEWLPQTATYIFPVEGQQRLKVCMTREELRAFTQTAIDEYGS